MKTLLFIGLLAIARAAPLEDLTASSPQAVKFYLYTQANPSSAQQLTTGDESSVTSSNFNKALQTKITIHGWKNSYLTDPNPQLRQAYLSRGDYNIIAVDWSEYAALDYIASFRKVPFVGEQVAAFIDFMNTKFGVSLDELVVIGHSLGAHVAGYAGKNVKTGQLGAIVGLDPAHPLYSYSKPEKRLASTDAKYVQTVQTDGELKGFLKPIGSAAFYPNWGFTQPGCGVDLEGSCSHARSVLYYAEAVSGYSFQPIYECASFKNIELRQKCSTLVATAAIGDPLDVPHLEGIFYFETAKTAPFGKKQ